MIMSHRGARPGTQPPRGPGVRLTWMSCELILSSGFSFKRFQMAQNFHVNEAPRARGPSGTYKSSNGQGRPTATEAPGLLPAVAEQKSRGGWGSPGALKNHAHVGRERRLQLGGAARTQSCACPPGPARWSAKTLAWTHRF